LPVTHSGGVEQHCLLVLFTNFVPITHHFSDIQLVNIQWPWNRS